SAFYMLVLKPTSNNLAYIRDQPLSPIRSEFVRMDPPSAPPPPPGRYLNMKCTVNLRTMCIPCPCGPFSTLWSYIDPIYNKFFVGLDEKEEKVCMTMTDLLCACRNGFFFPPAQDVCQVLESCPKNQGGQERQEKKKNCVCNYRSDSYYNLSSTVRKTCYKHQQFNSMSAGCVLSGSSRHDAGACNTKINGVFLEKRIIAGIYRHPKVKVKRLRNMSQTLKKTAKQKHKSSTKYSAPSAWKKEKQWVFLALEKQKHKTKRLLRQILRINNREKLAVTTSRVEKLFANCSIQTEKTRLPRTDIYGVV
uniref:Uncharacterized protein n=1 Tax=Oryzias latipes TaxID=8090 RepID=A0A3P9J0G8_ORYLA